MAALGARVRVKGLLAKPELNGRVGVCVERQEALKRWKVQFDDKSVFSLKDENVEALLAETPRLRFAAGSVSVQGLRESQEDRHVKIPDLAKAAKALKMPIEAAGPCAFVAVYDGHQGSGCSDFVAKNLHTRLLRRLASAAGPLDDAVAATALREAYEGLDAEYLARFRTAPDGSTAVTALLAGSRLHLAWAGDSRCVLGERLPDGRCAARPLSEDHRCGSCPREAQRVRDAGGEVVDIGDGSGRDARAGFEERNRELARAEQQGFGLIGKPPVALAVSRSFGDREFKAVKAGSDLVTATPEVHSEELTPQHAFIVLMSDGVTDVMSDGDVVQLMHASLGPCPAGASPEEETEAVRAACSALVSEALRRGSSDNITAAAVRLLWRQADPADAANRRTAEGPLAKRPRTTLAASGSPLSV